MVGVIKRFWKHPLSEVAEINESDTISIHRKIIQSKPIMRSIYRFWYKQFIESVEATKKLPGLMVEIGCGASHLEKYVPEIVKTDCVPHSNIHQVVDANSLPFADGSLRAIFVLNALHHFESPANFLKEAERCLRPNGRLVITEPSDSPLQQFMIRKFHPYEYFDANITEWVNTPNGRLAQANNALPAIIFDRDKAKVSQLFPKLKLIKKYRHTFLIYFASGGMSYRSFLPSVFLPLVWIAEHALRTLFPQWGTEMTVVFEKQ